VRTGNLGGRRYITFVPVPDANVSRGPVGRPIEADPRTRRRPAGRHCEKGPAAGLKAVVAIIAISVLAVSGAEQPEEPPSSAREILDSVLARLPDRPLDVAGDLTVRGRNGTVLRELKFDMMLRWGGSPSSARYTIRDVFGSELEQLTVIRNPDTGPEYEYAAGDPPTPARMPPLTASIRETDMSWADLCLSFLWWPHAGHAGQDMIRGRPCFMIDVRPSDADRAPYARVRLWIDKEIRMMVQAEAFDAEDRSVRRLWVKSVRKIDDRWMIRDMEVEAVPVVHRTRLRIQEAKDAEPGP